MIHVTRFTGPFGYIKPWTAVRDNETYSQNFLTPSIIEGIEKKLFPELLEQTDYPKRIVRHRLSYVGITRQQEQTQPRGIDMTVNKRQRIAVVKRPRSILIRGLLIEPVLFLAFSKEAYAQRAVEQHICLCRNEDVLLPTELPLHDSLIASIREDEFDIDDKGFDGFELLFEKTKQSFVVGFNRFQKSKPMYGRLHIVGSNPLRNATNESR
ncbi:MAG: hypothetical protein KF749_17960 [Bacteroidetes bacterium]|nr:hypothetical protein [Bacteroidota bacterium]MCW5896731.1 hypothetical protein [Bacteroidota bacterium]